MNIAMQHIFSDNDENSEWAKKALEAKKENGPEFWPTMRKVIEHDLETLERKSFRRWASIGCIPLANNSRMWQPITNSCSVAMDDEEFYNILVDDFIGIEDEWKQAFQVFHDAPFSAHRCYNADHLLKYDEFNDISEIKEMKTIVEIGGGYGDMASLIHKFGFEGDYYMFDFPEIHELQKYYLGRQGFSHIKYISDVEEVPESANLTIGTWSLSEMKDELRDGIIDKINSEHWLITYQNNIFGNSNHKYFVEKFDEIDYAVDNIPYMPFDGGNNYLIV